MKKRNATHPGHIIVLACLFCLAAVPALAGEISITISDANGLPATNGVVSLIPKDPSQPLPPAPSAEAVMDQVDKEFVPHVLAVRTGTRVRFPNSDNIRHHVYSFSKPKLMELKLYSSGETKAVTFDKPGVVVLGCNIHDWMVGYIVVVDTPYFARSDAAGNAVITGLPAGHYTLQAWHPRLRGKPVTREIQIPGTGKTAEEIRLKLKKKRKSKRHRLENHNHY